MDRGGVTRRRAYQWLTAVLFVVLLIVIFIVPARHDPQASETAAADLPQEAPPTEQNGHTPSRMSVAHGSASYGRAATVGSRQYPAAHAEPVSPPEHIFRKDKHVVVELNSADSLDLVQLYNIGPSFACRILKYRSLLGGYVSKEQLWEVYGMDSVRYNDIAPYITVNPEGITPMDLNSATLDQLKRHPYLDYYQAKAIVRLREQAGLFRNVQDLQKVPIIDNETYTKIKPYLTCNSQQNR